MQAREVELDVHERNAATKDSAFSNTRLPPELRQVLTCESPAVFLHFPLEEGALGPLLSAPAGASKRETPTSNLTESIERSAQMKAQCLLGACFTTDTADSYGGIAIHCIMLTMLLYFNNFTFYSAT